MKRFKLPVQQELCFTLESSHPRFGHRFGGIQEEFIWEWEWVDSKQQIKSRSWKTVGIQ